MGKIHIYCVDIMDAYGNRGRTCYHYEPLSDDIKFLVKAFAERYGSDKIQVTIKKIPVMVIAE